MRNFKVGLGINAIDYQDELLNYNKRLYDYIEFTVTSDFLNFKIPESLLVYSHSSNLQPCHFEPITENTINFYNNLASKYNFPWFVEDLGFWHDKEAEIGYNFIPVILNRNFLEITKKNLKYLLSKLTVPFLPENPPYIFQVGNIHIMDFFSELVTECNTFFTLDIGHLLSYQLCIGKTLKEAIPLIPWDNIMEIHIAGGQIENSIYNDSHVDTIVPECLEFLPEVISRARNLKAVTVEAFGGTTEVMLRNLTVVQDVIDFIDRK